MNKTPYYVEVTKQKEYYLRRESDEKDFLQVARFTNERYARWVCQMANNAVKFDGELDIREYNDDLKLVCVNGEPA